MHAFFTHKEIKLIPADLCKLVLIWQKCLKRIYLCIVSYERCALDSFESSLISRSEWMGSGRPQVAPSVKWQIKECTTNFFSLILLKEKQLSTVTI